MKAVEEEMLKLRKGSQKNSKDFGDRLLYLVAAFHSLDSFARSCNTGRCTGFAAALAL